MTALLTDNLPLLASAPNGIKKLRELILELAVRGKLAPQDPNDEPASELLKRIAEEKARLVAEGRIKKPKAMAEIGEEEKLFELPSGWEWQRLDGISPMSLVDGDWIESKDQDPSGGIRLLQLADIGVNVFKDKSDRFVNAETFARLNCTALEAGDILIARLPSPIGRACIFPELSCKAITVVDVAILRPLSTFSAGYVVNAINSICFREQVEAYGKGATRFRIATGHLKTLLIPIPPLPEQHRIVAKVDELMALCDRLEAQQTDAESAHAQLVQALLASLTQASDADDFAQSWQRLAEHFHTLFTTESSIDALKQTFLCLAADGRLVRSSIHADYLTLSDVIEGDSLNGSSKKPQDSPGAVEILRISAGTGVADFLTDEYEHKWADVTEAEIQKFLLAKEDLLACRFNGNLHYVGAFSLYCGNRGVPQIFPDKLIRFRADRNKASPHYLKYILNAAPARAQIESFCATTVGNIGISAKNLKTIKLRLPSLEEQSDIVNRLDQLMALCDQLKSRLAQARQLHEQLASTLVEQAVA